MDERSELIRVKSPTKQVLQELKIMEEESFNSVITRLIEDKLEESLELTQETKAKLEQRMKSVKEGKVYSLKELLEKTRKARQNV